MKKELGVGEGYRRWLYSIEEISMGCYRLTASDSMEPDGYNHRLEIIFPEIEERQAIARARAAAQAIVASSAAVDAGAHPHA